MIYPAFSSPKNFKSAVSPNANGEIRWFIFSGSQLLVGNNGKCLPTEAWACDCLFQRTLYIGTLDGVHLFAGELEADVQAPAGWLWSHLRPLYFSLSEEDFAIAGQALHLLQWDRSNTYCGKCGSLTIPMDNERCRECKTCGQLAYPKLTPAILALVKRENKILLAHGSQFPKPFYSALAGFVEPGETLEQCVYREVLEEVGIKVNTIKYFGSQPWPFSSSLMIGFSCEWEEGEINIDPIEIIDARWFEAAHLPILPPVYSLSRLLIDHVVAEISIS